MENIKIKHIDPVPFKFQYLMSSGERKVMTRGEAEKEQENIVGVVTQEYVVKGDIHTAFDRMHDAMLKAIETYETKNALVCTSSFSYLSPILWVAQVRSDF